MCLTHSTKSVRFVFFPIHSIFIKNLPCLEWGFPGGSGVKNPPTNEEDTGDTDSIPGSG